MVLAPEPPCEAREVDVELGFTADDVLTAASIGVTDVVDPVEDAFVAGGGEAWTVPVTAQFAFSQDGEPSVVEYDDLDPADAEACPVGPALRVPVALHVHGTLGDGEFDHELAQHGRYALVATDPSVEGLSVEHDSDRASDRGKTTLDPDTRAALVASTVWGAQCPADAVVLLTGIPTGLAPGSFADDVARGGLGVGCPDEGDGAALRWGAGWPDP